jgi:hypothetical protein
MKLSPKEKRKLALAIALVMGSVATAYSIGGYLTQFENKYPAASGTQIDSCSLCHTDISQSSARNSYGAAFGSNSHNFAAIESLDSDGDGFTNLQEISAKTFPGNAGSKPAATDTAAPTINAFAIPATASSLTVTITSFSASDNVGVTGYLVTESSTRPLTSVSGWSPSPQENYVFSTAGTKTLYAWAKDAAGNVSNSLSASTTITLSNTAAPPVISAFSITATSNSLTVPVTSFVVSGTSGVSGYLLKESSTAPTAVSSGWLVSTPTSFTFSGAGPRTVYAWVRDAAGNISNPASSSTVITLADAGTPVVTSFSIPSEATTRTIPILSFAATDSVGVTGYLVTEDSDAPTAQNPGWTARPPDSFTFDSAGLKTLYAWAKNTAGKVSSPNSARIKITNPPLDPSSMSLWEGKWFRVNVSHSMGDDISKRAYWKFRKWDSASRTLLTTLYIYNEETRLWESLEITVNVITGSTLRFLFAFDYAGSFGFTGSIAARTDSRQTGLASANIRAFGLYQATEESDDDELDELVNVRGNLIPDSLLPLNIPQN